MFVGVSTAPSSFSSCGLWSPVEELGIATQTQLTEVAYAESMQCTRRAALAHRAPVAPPRLEPHNDAGNSRVAAGDKEAGNLEAADCSWGDGGSSVQRHLPLVQSASALQASPTAAVPCASTPTDAVERNNATSRRCSSAGRQELIVNLLDHEVCYSSNVNSLHCLARWE